MKYERITIDLERNHALVKCLARNGAQKTKVTDLGGVMRLFKDQTETDTGDLPIIGENCIGIRRIYRRGNRGVVLVNGVNLKRDLRYDDTYKGINLPSLLMAVKFEERNGRFNILDSYLYAHENIITGDNDTLYVPPFGNVYPESACRICWGSAGLRELQNLGQALGMLDLFVSSNFNQDLYRSSYARGIYDNGDLGELLQKMQDHSATHDRFPYGEARLTRSRTYGELINYIQNNL